MLNPSISTTMRLQFGELNITPRVVDRLHELDFTVPELEDAINDHKSPCDGEPSVYCGTYGKYNDGSLCGLWIDLSSFDDYDEFINFCKAIHADEEDPELMSRTTRDSPASGTARADSTRTTSTTSRNTASCATSTIRMPWTTTWSFTTNSTASRKPTAVTGTAKKTSPATSSRSATTLTGSWVISQTTSTTKPSHATCSCTTTRWAQTTTCSAWSDPVLPLSSLQGSPSAEMCACNTCAHLKFDVNRSHIAVRLWNNTFWAKKYGSNLKKISDCHVMAV